MDAKNFAWNDEKLDSILSSMAAMKPVGSTGIASLDRVLGGGLHPEVYVLAAEPGAGKTTLALQIADYVARFGSRRVVFVSAEMSVAQIVAKSLSRLSAETPFDLLTVRDVMRMDAERIKDIEAAADIYRAEVAPHISTIDEAATVQSIASLYASGFDPCEPKPVLVVDYLQIMPSSTDAVQTDTQHHASNMSALCEVSKRHRVPVLVISSMNRSGRKDSALASLAGSSAIEYGASAVMFVSVDGEGEVETKTNKEAAIRPVTLSVVKNRFGITGDVPLYFKAAEGRFIERVVK